MARENPTTPRVVFRSTLLIIGILVASLVLLRLEGRRWWCECGEVRLWVGDIWSKHCSQHILDPYALTHLSYGMIVCGILAWLRPRWSIGRRLWITVGASAAWEVFENTELIINRFRSATVSLGYTGDSTVNALGDTISVGVGFFVARALGRWKSIALFVLIEVGLLLTVRDNMSLNVLMMIYPIPAIKTWQTTGQWP